MTNRLIVAVIGALAAGAATGALAWVTPNRAIPEPVKQDLDTAMKGEAFAYAKYMLFAQEARAHGHPDIAQLFEKTAQTERMEHFREHAQLAGLTTGSDADNLRNAMAGEGYESTTMYPGMAARARQAGDGSAASRFAEIGRDEAKHRAAFAAALAKLEGGASHR
ncbi:MAG: rubrerythrin family protein [Sphingomonas sp.]